MARRYQITITVDYDVDGYNGTITNREIENDLSVSVSAAVADGLLDMGPNVDGWNVEVKTVSSSN
jgi:hypothetical protein